MHIEHLVVDSSAFIHSGPIKETGNNIYSCQEAIDEIKDKATLERLKFLPYELKLIQFDKDEFDFCCEFAKKSGDFRQLSVVDLKLIAAIYRLEKQFNGTKFINQSPKQMSVVPRQQVEQTQAVETPSDAVPDEWITPDNIDEYKKNPAFFSEPSTDDGRIRVACMTSDFSMQNCLLQMGLHVVSPIDGMIIKEAKRIALRCHACYKVYPDPSKVKNEFCPHCGNLDTLKRVQYLIDDQGMIKVLINYKRPIKVKGTNRQLPRPRGGKHANNPVLAPDQRIRRDKQEKLIVNERKLMTAEHILQDPAYLVRTNPFARRGVRQ